MDKKMKVISLGWGVQSFTLAAMIALDELEPVDAAIHADTTHERSATYEFERRWTPWLEERGIRVITVHPIGNRVDPTRASETNSVMIPASTDTGTVGGGRLRRQCTDAWKIAPMRRWLQANRNNQPVEMWIGISLDEVERMRPSDVKYITNRWPLIENHMSRNDCRNWLQRHGLEVPQKSSCVFCPFHNRSAWWAMKGDNGSDWQKAIEVDEAIRKLRPPYDIFVHQDMIPLAEIKSPHDNGQLDLFTSEECNGICFV